MTKVIFLVPTHKIIYTQKTRLLTIKMKFVLIITSKVMFFAFFSSLQEIAHYLKLSDSRVMLDAGLTLF